MKVAHIFAATIFACVAFLNCAQADQPLAAPEDYPEYELSNFRVEDDDFGRASLVADYKRIKEGKGTQLVQIAARSSDGELHVMGFPLGWRDAGEIRLSKMFRFGGSRTYDYEIYLVAHAHWAGKSYGKCMVSNTVRMGNPGDPTIARALNEQERAAYEKNKLANVPPESTPAGLVTVTLATQLVPGMTVLAGNYGEWKEAELMGFASDDRVVLRFVGEKRVIRRPREKWLAVDPEVLGRVEADPSQFQASGVVLEDGHYAIPSDAVPLPADLELTPGTPLLYERGGKWKVAFVLRERGDKVRVHYENMDAAFDEEKPRTYFALQKETLAKLKIPSARDEFATNVPQGGEFGGRSSGFGHRQDRFRHNYPMTEPIPRGAQRIPDGLVLPKGTTLAVCQGLRWRRVSVVADNGDGTVEIDWYDREPVWDGDVARDQLIIEKKTLRRLEQATATSSKSPSSQEIRTWKDASGQHEVEATFIRQTATTVTLRMKDGREKTLKIEKLSKPDQKFLSELESTVENPFAP